MHARGSGVTIVAQLAAMFPNYRVPRFLQRIVLAGFRKSFQPFCSSSIVFHDCRVRDGRVSSVVDGRVCSIVDGCVSSVVDGCVSSIVDGCVSSKVDGCVSSVLA